jgi:Mn-dependent DtxR family transcriptional regulator
MSEGVLLALLARYPHRVAIARRVSATALQEGVPRLERAGLVVGERETYRVTARGRRALEFDRRLRATIRRALLGSGPPPERPAV